MDNSHCENQNQDQNVYEITGRSIIFSKKFNQSLKPYYKIISQMISLKLEGEFSQELILMPNIKILFCGCYLTNVLTLTKNIVCLTTIFNPNKVLPKNMIFLDIKRINCMDITEIKINKYMKYLFLSNAVQHITKLNKNMVKYYCDSFLIKNCLDTDIINFKMQHLYLERGYNRQVQLPKKLITLSVCGKFNGQIILTPYIKYLMINSNSERSVILEHPLNMLSISNEDWKTIENIPNGVNKLNIKLSISNMHAINNMPNDLGFLLSSKKVYLGNIHIKNILKYGYDNNFPDQNSESDRENYITQIYLHLVQTTNC